MSLKPTKTFGLRRMTSKSMPIQQSHDAVAAAGTPHGGRFRIGKRGHQFVGARRIVAGQITGAAVDVAVGFDAKPALANARERPIDPLAIHRPGRRDDADRIAAFADALGLIDGIITNDSLCAIDG